MADDEAAILQAARSQPLGDRVAHKNWKVRCEVYEEIKASCQRVFSSEDPILSQYVGFFPKAMADVNAAALDKALEALSALLSKADESLAARIAGPVCSGLASKVLKQRPGTIQRAKDVCLEFCELEQGEAVVENIMKAFSDKVPKVVVAAADIVTTAVSQFGVKVIPPQQILKSLPKLFDAKQEPVRDGAKKLTMELCSWMGAANVQATLVEKMPDAMRKDVEKSIQEAPAGRKQPERFTRKEQARRAAAPAPGPASRPDEAAATGPAASAAAAPEEEEGMDAYDFSEPVDVFKQLGKEFWSGLASKKWTERRDALQSLRALAKTPKIAPGDFGEVSRELKKILTKDSNIVCVAEAAAVMGLLAKGLRSNYSGTARALCPSLLDKLKDKNIVACQNLAEALGYMHKYCFSLADIQDDLVAALDHKNPKVKVETLKTIQAFIGSTSKASAAKVHSTVLPAAAKAAGEAAPDIREAALGVLVAFAMKAGSASVLSKATAKLDDARKKKLDELFQQAVSGGGTSAAAAAKGGVTTTSSASSSPGIKRGVSMPATGPSAEPPVLGMRSSNAQPAAGAGASGKASVARRLAPTGSQKGKAAAGAGGGSGVADDDDAGLAAGTLSKEDAKQTLLQLFGEGVLEGLQSANWKERLTSMERLLEQVHATKENLNGSASALVQSMSYLPGWSEKNFQVMSKAFELISLVATESPSMTKKDAFLAIGGLVDKITDIKLKGPAGQALTATSEALGPQFVCMQLHKKAVAHKNPKVLSESLMWMGTAVEEFGLGPFDVKALIEWAKADLASTNAGVRNATIHLLSVCHKQLGPGLADMLRSDVKPALMTALEDSFKRNPQQQVVPARMVRRGGRGQKQQAGSAPAAGPAEAAEDSPAAFDPDELLPRADISGHITGKLVTSLGSVNWKERNAAVEEVEEILKAAGGRIQPSLGDLMPALKAIDQSELGALMLALKARLGDSNRNLAARVLLLLGELAKAIGAAFDRIGRPLLGTAVANLSDSKSQVRNAVVTMLEAWQSATGPDRLVPAVADAIATPKASTEAKLAGLRFISSVVEGGQAGKCLDAVVRAAAVGLQDKAVDPREAGAGVIQQVLAVHGAEEAAAAAASLPAAARQAVLDTTAKAGTAAPGPGPASRPATASRSDAAGIKVPEIKVSSRTNSVASLGSRPASVRGSRATGLQSRSNSAATLAAAASALGSSNSGPCLLVSDRKDDRAKKARFTLKTGKFEGVREDEAEGLETDLAPQTSDTLRALLFSKDFRQHVEAADMLLGQLPDIPEAAVSNLDLLLRWAVLRMCDGNTQCLLKVLEMCKALLELCQQMDCQLTEYEAAVFVPCLIEKAGHNQDRIRHLHRELLQQARALHPTLRIVDMLVVGLASKNNRTRVEAAEALGDIIADEGVPAIEKARHRPLPALAQLVSDRDKATRSAVLGALEAVYMQEGPSGFWDMLGRLNDQQKSLISERLKYTDKQAVKTGSRPGSRRAARLGQDQGVEAEPSSSAPARSESQVGLRPLSRSSFGAPAVNQSGSFQPNALASHAMSNPAAPSAAARRPAALATPPIRAEMTPPHQSGTGAVPSSMPTPVPAATPMPGIVAATSLQTPPPDGSGVQAQRRDEEVEEQWQRGFSMLQGHDLPQAVEGMKVLCYELMEATAGRASPSTLGNCAAQADGLVKELTAKVHQVFDAAIQDMEQTGLAPSSRGCKYALNTLMQTFQLRTMATNIASRTLRECCAALLVRLLDKQVPKLQEGTQLLKALNVLMLKILDHANRTYSFSALLVLLRYPPEGLHRQGSAAEIQFNDLVVKCLIKLTKALSTTMDEVDLDELLLSIHDFFMGLGVDEIRRRGADDDKPLRMVKTILHELCKIKGTEIKQHMAGIPHNHEPAPIIHAYVDLNLQTLHSAGLISGPTPSQAAAPAAPMQASGRTAPATQGSSSRAPSAGMPPAQAGSSSSLSHQDSAAGVGSGQTSPPGSTHSSNSPTTQETKARLAGIFKKIGDKATTERGLEELWQFQKDLPEVDINPHLAKTSPQFRQYIERGLAKVERRMQAQQAAASQPVSSNGVANGVAAEALTLPSSIASEAYASPKPSGGADKTVDALRERLNRVNMSSGGRPDGVQVQQSGSSGEGAATGTMAALQLRMQRLRMGSKDEL